MSNVADVAKVSVSRLCIINYDVVVDLVGVQHRHFLWEKALIILTHVCTRHAFKGSKLLYLIMLLNICCKISVFNKCFGPKLV
jgi:hypothetical protein